MPVKLLKQLLADNDPGFWSALNSATESASDFNELIVLSSLRKKALLQKIERAGDDSKVLRLAILGGCSLYPLHELLAHLIDSQGIKLELFLGAYDNFIAEIADPKGSLYDFKPDVVFLLPGGQRCRYAGPLTDSAEAMRLAADQVAFQLLDLCRLAHERSGAEIILGNFILPARHDPGQLRARILGSDWNFRKWVNLEIGLRAPPFVRICDLEFLANRHGGLAAEDSRAWFESKQLCSPSMQVVLCREVALILSSLRAPMKKVLVLDLDNTLWGGVVAEDGVDGIEIGDTSPRGEAFKAFQRYVLSLKERGVLLAVCSKNDHVKAIEPFERHPEMLLRVADFVAFKANWEPKSDNLVTIAAELKLGIDSLVFADDNPAEIEIVRQFAPAVAAILLGPDPSDYVGQLQDCRLFETASITLEDQQRSSQYRSEVERQSLRASMANMDSYLESLGMEAVIREFTADDLPRLSQLINKSNQFNLTTRRRTEAELNELAGDPNYVCISMRLRDKFGDNGLISVVIGSIRERVLQVDTWIMSCRVLKRHVEETMLNELLRIARGRGCASVRGIYIPTNKNDMVRSFYPQMGFAPDVDTAGRSEFVLDVSGYTDLKTKITIIARPYEST